MWIIYALLSAFSAALVAIFGKLGLKSIDTTIATTVRSIVMALFLILATLFLKKSVIGSVLHFQNKEWAFIILAGIAGALSWLFYFAALKQGLATHVASIDRLSIVFVIILSAFFLGEKLSLWSGIGALLIACGAILIVRS